MDQVFKHLIMRATPQPVIKIGTPWQCIPIKNDKQARDTVEVHMSDQGINELSSFDKFMNLEVVWLNGNQLLNIKGLEQNFRIKHLYLHDNKINTLQGLDELKHLETLSLFGNELRNLENNLEILSYFPSLTKLDLFNNPLAEEPYYRNRVITALPQLQLLDRHIITVQEQIKVKKWAKEFKAEVKIKKKGPQKIKLLPSQIFSRGERLLYQEAKEIKINREEQIQNEIAMETLRIKSKEKTYDQNKLPGNELKEELRRKRKEDPLSIVNEWEKGKYKKFFKVYDKGIIIHYIDKKGYISQESVTKLYDDLMQDCANIGKVPAISVQEFQGVMSQDPLHWDQFCFNLNLIHYQRAPEEQLNAKINEKYKDFNRKLNAGKRAEGKEWMYDAIKLEAARDMAEHKHPEYKIENKQASRVDTFSFSKFVHRNQFQDNQIYSL